MPLTFCTVGCHAFDFSQLRRRSEQQLLTHLRPFKGTTRSLMLVPMATSIQSAAPAEAKPKASGQVSCPFWLKLERTILDPSVILVTESIWPDEHDVITTQDNLQLLTEDSSRVLTFMEYGIKPKRIQEIMNREADRVFGSSLSQADSSVFRQQQLAHQHEPD